jgi:hypothetical protein
MAKEPAKRSRAKSARPKAKKKAGKKAARKKAPKKRGRKKKAYGDSTVTTITGPKTRTLGHIRHEAGLRYIYDTERRTLAWWHENHYQNEVGIATLREWCAKDGWVDQRDQHWEQVYAAVAREIAGKAAKAHINEAKEIVEARGTAFEMIRGVDDKGRVTPLPAVQSYEGVVGAFVKLDKRLDEKRTSVMDSLPLGSSDGTVPNESTGVQFSPGEYRAMARAIIRERHALPASTDIGSEDVGTEEKGEV